MVWGQNRTQLVDLSKGWNAISFEVTPSVSDPAILFGENDEILEVVAYIPASISSSFLINPGEELHNHASWPRWRREGNSAELLNNMGSVQARLPYFVHCSEPTTLTVMGVPAPKTWPLRNSGFSFVSFPVNDRGNVTLSDYFAHAAVQPDRVFRLEGDRWVAVGNSQFLRRNTVYCVHFSRSPPDYFGPIDFRNLPTLSPFPINTRSRGGALDYRPYSPESGLALTLEKISGDLQLEVRDGFLSEQGIPLSGSLSLAGLGQGEAGRVFFQALNYGSAIVRFADAGQTTAFYAVIEHPNPED